MRPASSDSVDEYRGGGRWEGVWHKKQAYCHAVTFISDIGIGYRVRLRVDIGYRHFPKFTYRSDTNHYVDIGRPTSQENVCLFYAEGLQMLNACLVSYVKLLMCN